MAKTPRPKKKAAAKQALLPSPPVVNIADLTPQPFLVTLPQQVAGTTQGTVTSMCYQINAGKPRQLRPPYASWSFTLTIRDLPDPGTYTLTVYAYDSNSQLSGHDSRQIRRN
jgi:hypothetical protein